MEELTLNKLLKEHFYCNKIGWGKGVFIPKYNKDREYRSPKMDCDIFMFNIIPAIFILLCLLQQYFLHIKSKSIGFIADALVLCR